MSSPKIKVSQMSSALIATPIDYLMMLQDGVSKKISMSSVLSNMNSANSIRFNPAGYAVNISLASKNDLNAIVVNGATDKIGIGTDNPQSKFHVNGNAQVGSTTADGITIQSTEIVQYTALDQTNVITKEVSTLRAGTILNCDSGTNGKFSISSGNNGQLKVIVVNTLSGGNSAVISLTGLGFNTITCDAIGNSITLQYFSTIAKWCVISKNGAVTSTV